MMRSMYRATARAWTIPEPNGAMLTLSTAAAKIWSTQQGFPAIPGRMRPVLPLLSISLLMLLIINLLSFLIINLLMLLIIKQLNFPIINQLNFHIIRLSNLLITSLPMPAMSSLPIPAIMSQCMVTITLLVTTRDLVIIPTLSNLQVHSFQSLLFNNHQSNMMIACFSFLYLQLLESIFIIQFI